MGFALLLGCSSDSGAPTRPPPAAPWSGEIRVVDASGTGVPGLLVQVSHALQELPKKNTSVSDVGSTTLVVYTDHDGIAWPETEEVSQLWIHQLRVSADDELLHEQSLRSTGEQTLGVIDDVEHLFRFDVSVEYDVPAARDSAAVASVLGTWQTTFVEDGISFGRKLTYRANGSFQGALTQDGNEFLIQGRWVVRNLILTTSFEFNGQQEQHSTRFQVSGTTLTTTGIPAGTPRQWERL